MHEDHRWMEAREGSVGKEGQGERAESREAERERGEEGRDRN